MDRGKRVLLFAVALCAVAAVWYVVYYHAMQAGIRDLRRDIATRTRQLTQGARSSVTLPVLQKQAEEARRQLALRTAALPLSDELPGLVRGLARLGDPLRVRLVYAEPLEVVSEGPRAQMGIGVLRMRLHMEGAFLAVGEYLEALARQPHFAGFGALDCEGQEDRSAVTAVLETYLFVLDREAAPPEAPPPDAVPPEVAPPASVAQKVAPAAPQKAQPSSEDTTSQADGAVWAVQASAYLSAAGAQTALEALRTAGYSAYIVESVDEGRLWRKVRVGFYPSLQEAREVARRIRSVTGVSSSAWAVRPSPEELAAQAAGD